VSKVPTTPPLPPRPVDTLAICCAAAALTLTPIPVGGHLFDSLIVDWAIDPWRWGVEVWTFSRAQVWPMRGVDETVLVTGGVL
jgi:hypothetical protein